MFHALFQAIIPIIQDIWMDRCIDRNKPVLGGRIVAEYDSLLKKVTHLYTLREMVLPEDELKIYNKTMTLKIRRYKPTIEKVDKQMEASHRS